MSGTTLATVTALRVEFETALTTVATGQSYSIGIRSFTRANLKEIRETLTWLNDWEKELIENAEGGLIQSQFTIIDT